MAYRRARLCNKLVDVHLKPLESITIIPVVSVWPLIKIFYVFTRNHEGVSAQFAQSGHSERIRSDGRSSCPFWRERWNRDRIKARVWASETSRGQVALGAGESLGESAETTQASNRNQYCGSCHEVLEKTSHGNAVGSKQSWSRKGKERWVRRDGSWVQCVVMDSEVKMFLISGVCFSVLGYVLTQLLYVTELNDLLHWAIYDWLVYDRLDWTGWWAPMMRVKPETVEWLLEPNGWCVQWAALPHSRTGGRRQVCGVPVDGSSIEDDTVTSTLTSWVWAMTACLHVGSVHRPCNVNGHPVVHLRCTDGSEARQGIKPQVGQSSNDRWRVHPRNSVLHRVWGTYGWTLMTPVLVDLLLISYLVVEWRFAPHRIGVWEIKCILLVWGKSLYGLGSCHLLWPLAQRLFVARTCCAFQAIRLRSWVSRFSSERKHFTCLCHSIIHDRESGLSKSTIVSTRTDQNALYLVECDQC